MNCSPDSGEIRMEVLFYVFKDSTLIDNTFDSRPIDVYANLSPVCLYFLD